MISRSVTSILVLCALCCEQTIGFTGSTAHYSGHQRYCSAIDNTADHICHRTQTPHTTILSMSGRGPQAGGGRRRPHQQQAYSSEMKLPSSNPAAAGSSSRNSGSRFSNGASATEFSLSSSSSSSSSVGIQEDNRDQNESEDSEGRKSSGNSVIEFDDRGGVIRSEKCPGGPDTLCYFDKATPCSKKGLCPIDDRPCEANRDYFDHVYGNDGEYDGAISSLSSSSSSSFWNQFDSLLAQFAENAPPADGENGEGNDDDDDDDCSHDENDDDDDDGDQGGDGSGGGLSGGRGGGGGSAGGGGRGSFFPSFGGTHMMMTPGNFDYSAPSFPFQPAHNSGKTREGREEREREKSGPKKNERSYLPGDNLDNDLHIPPSFRGKNSIFAANFGTGASTISRSSGGKNSGKKGKFGRSGRPLGDKESGESQNSMTDMYGLRKRGASRSPLSSLTSFPSSSSYSSPSSPPSSSPSPLSKGTKKTLTTRRTTTQTPRRSLAYFSRSSTDPSLRYVAATSASFYRMRKALTKRERRERKRKLFLMSTWLEDLLPDPSQGSSMVANAIVDMLKVSYRITAILLAAAKIAPKPKIVIT